MKAGDYILKSSKTQREALQRMKIILNYYLAKEDVMAVESPRNKSRTIT